MNVLRPSEASVDLVQVLHQRKLVTDVQSPDFRFRDEERLGFWIARTPTP